MNAKLFAALFAISSGSALAQQNLESSKRTTGAEVLAVFEPQREVLQKCSAVILNGREEAIYGTVMSADGYIMTKASEYIALTDPKVTVDRTKYDAVSLVGMDLEWDVVLLKVDAKDLVPVALAQDDQFPEGTWVFANGATSRRVRRLAPGVISAHTREIPAAGGAVLGVTLAADKGKEPLKIEKVHERSGALKAGLKKGDIITELDGVKVETMEKLSKGLEDRRAGSIARLKWKRGDEEMSGDVTLSARLDLFAELKTRNDAMSGDYSFRRSGFPRVMQHSILCNSKTVGGPVINLEGKCLGMNIARANRAETFAIPAKELGEIFARLRGDGGSKMEDGRLKIED